MYNKVVMFSSQEIEDQPLMTAAMRKAKVEVEYGRYNRVVIRVQFHDKLTLQGLFRPRETGIIQYKFSHFIPHDLKF